MEIIPVFESREAVVEKINNHEVDELLQYDWEKITAGFKAECLQSIVLSICDDDARLAVVLYLLPWVVAAWTNIYYDELGRKIVYDFDKPFFETVGMVTTLLIYVVFEFAAAAMRVLICCKPGTAGRNEFGADPVRYLARDAE